MKPYLKINDRLALHLARPEMAEMIFNTVEAHRHFLREWLPWVDPTRSLEDTKKFIAESMEHNNKGTRLTMFLTLEQQIAGSLGVVQFNREFKKCEIGYWLRQDLQGQGIMSTAGTFLINYLFKTKDLNRIELLVASENYKSQGVAHRLGFTKEGTLRQGLFMHNRFFNLDIFSLLRQEWETLYGVKFNQKI